MNAERMRLGLLVIASNLRGDPFDSRPLSNSFACRVANFAVALANDEPWPEFDNSARDASGEAKS